jgi:transposase-like protein
MEPMPKPRKQFSPALKAKVAIEAIKGEKTSTAIGKIYSIHPNLVGIWKRQALAVCGKKPNVDEICYPQYAEMNAGRSPNVGD